MSEINDIIGINPVKEIKMYLKELSKHNSEIIITNTDGIFDSETKKSSDYVSKNIWPSTKWNS